MSDPRELYQEMILDHYRSPKNRRSMESAELEAQGSNPLCGDEITVYVRVKDGVIDDISFEGLGCAISTASASMMTEALKGKTVDEAQGLFGKFRKMVTARMGETVDVDEVGKLQVFSGVREYPVRVKCATLCWHTMQAALSRDESVVTTE